MPSPLARLGSNPETSAVQMTEKEALKKLGCRIAELPYEKGFTQETVAEAIEVAESHR